ncbi:MAG: two-component regulator propeller domain-containing protein [Bacteroidota bacterium]
MNFYRVKPNIKNHTFIIIVGLYVVMLLNSYCFFGQERSKFFNISPTHNNKSISVVEIIQDHYGYIWMRYDKGIARYDGYNFMHTPINEIFDQHESDDQIIGLNKDYKNNIWITSKNGLISVCDTLGNFNVLKAAKEKKVKLVYTNNKSIILGTKNGEIFKYNYNNDQLELITSIPDISHNFLEILDIVETDTNELFISTDKGKIFQYSPGKNELKSLHGPFSDHPENLQIELDLSNKLWIGTETFGLFSYDIAKKQFIQDGIYKSPLYSIKNEMFISLFCDSKGYLWAGTDGGGLYRVDTNSGKIQLFVHHETNKFSLSSNTVTDIYEDSHKNIWVLTNYGGIHILPEINNKLKYFEGSENNTPSKVLSVYRSKNGRLWVGTDGDGITRIETHQNKTSNEQYFSGDKLKKGLYVQSITEDNLSNVWFGTYKNGLWYYDNKKDKFEKILVKNSMGQNVQDVRTVFTDSKNRIWVGSNLSLNVYSNNRSLLATFENNTHGLRGDIAESIIEDNNGTIWVGYYKGGLFKFEENSNNITRSNFAHINYYEQEKFSNDIPGVRSMALDDSGLIWLINSHGILHSYNPMDYSHKSYRNFQKFEDINIKSVLVEDKNNLWLSSTNGIYHFNVKDSTVSNYLDIDGFQDNLFISRSAFKDKDGALYFGGVNGLNEFFPKDIRKKESDANLFINSIDILNQPAKTIIPNQIKSDIQYLKKIILKPDESSFTFRFSALDNVLNPNYHYSYRLKGFNDEWIPVKNERLASYTNIPSGKYTFEVKAGIKKGVWDIPSKKIDIIILQPIWNRPIAYIVYALLLLLLGVGAKSWYDLKKKLISEKMSYKNEKELHALKMGFFAKMSHEIQTPLTLISGPIDDMLIRASENGNLLLKQRLQIISNNVKRLSRIVFELTSVRNIELGKTKLMVTKNNLFEELNNIGLSFKEQARLKNIDFSINCPENLSEVWYDREKFEHIIYNLLSNAFKFTPKEGNIRIIALPINNKNSIKISVSDSGPGISEKEMSNIFTLFYQSKIGKKTKGTGIGLALTKELIDLHRGKIEVNSNPVEGTTFTISLPITKDAYLEDERIVTETEEIKTDDRVIASSETETTTSSKHNRTILIVEDNLELLHFIKDLLSPIYNVILAENGKEGYYHAKNSQPDLILSDIMMPEMDGIEMCKKIQNDKLIKHIPIVLLTAKNSTKSKILGLESGAIEFINKPFNTNELLLKINNIISSTEQIISNFRKEIINTPEININKSNDDIFLENLIRAINEKIEDPNFKMEELAEALNVSYSVLYRKCQAITGKGLIDLVRLLRLKKAAIVIGKYGYSITEAAYVSGFNDPKYFSKCFKKQFGSSPNVFKKEAAAMGSENYLKKYKLDDHF